MIFPQHCSLKSIFLFSFLALTTLLQAQSSDTDLERLKALNRSVEFSESYEPTVQSVSVDSMYAILDSYIKNGATKFTMIYEPVKGKVLVMRSDKLAKETLKKAKPNSGDIIRIGYYDHKHKQIEKWIPKELQLRIK